MDGASSTAPEQPRSDRQRILYGRRKGRPLRRGEQRLLAELLPRIALTLPEAGGIAPPLPADFCKSGLWLEVGFGAGEHLLAQAEAHPDKGIIGCEPYETGIARLLAGIHDRGLSNVRVVQDDARALVARLPDASVERAFVLFPDPWPKLRHHKRRFLNREVIRDLARVLRDGGELRVATDHVGYLDWILEHVRATGLFEWTARRPADWRMRPADWPQTRYEAKARAAGRSCAYLLYRRLSRADEA